LEAVEATLVAGKGHCSLGGMAQPLEVIDGAAACAGVAFTCSRGSCSPK